MADSSTGSEITPTKKDKTCLVCGDKALGYNFSAVSCESCKAFFRRNAHKVIRGRCDGSCQVTVESRSFCKRCRLHKCFKVGMRKDMILSTEQKGVRKQKIILNRLRKRDHADKTDLSVSEMIPHDEGGKTGATHCTLEEAEIESLNSLPTITMPAQPTQLLGESQSLMSELEEAHKEALKVVVKTSQMPTPTSAAEFFNLAEGSVRRIVKLAKGIYAFMSLPKDDQIALLKGAVTEIMMLRSATYFDVRNKAWNVNANAEPSEKSLHFLRKYSTASSATDSEGAVAGGSNDDSEHQSPTTSKKSELLKGVSLLQFGEDTKVMFFEYVKFVKSLFSVVHGDLTIIHLLTALTLFSSDRPGIVERERVQQVQELYAELLKNYLCLNFPEEPGLFPRVIMKLTDIRDISETHSKMLAKMEVGQVEPLLAEIFDIGM